MQHKKATATISTSYGIICLNNEGHVLLVQRKDSFGYLTCIDNEKLAMTDVSSTLATLTKAEKDKLIHLNWDALWSDCFAGNQHKLGATTYKQACKARFEWLGIKETIQLLDRKGYPFHDANQWGLPKGRMARADTDNGLRCALRELREETGIDSTQVRVHTSTDNRKAIKFVDEYIGTDSKLYETQLFVASLMGKQPAVLHPQTSEVQSVEWCPLDGCRERLGQSTYDIICLALAEKKLA